MGAGFSVRFAALAVVLSLSACAKQSHQKEQRLPDGSVLLECELSLRTCLAQAERLCRDESYTVLAANHVVRHYGADTGDSKVVLQSSSARVRCLSRGAEPPNVTEAPGAKAGAPAKSAASPPPRVKTAPPAHAQGKPARDAADGAEAAAPAKAVLCVPGASQACVGPGGCQGGQVCLADGSGLGPCDCGAAR